MSVELIRPGRTITGMSAVLLPFTDDAAIDWDSTEAHIARTVDTDPAVEWIFVVDQLNTHMSESLVKFVAERCGLPDALGKKVTAAF